MTILKKCYDQQVNGFSVCLKKITLLHINQSSDQTKKYCCCLDYYANLVDTREIKVIWKEADQLSSLVLFSRLKMYLKERFQVLRLSSSDKGKRKVITKN